MNIYKKIEKMKHLTESEKIFLDYMKEHVHEIEKLNVKQLATKSYVSISTIYRVLEKLEMNGINELKMQMLYDRESFQKENASVDYNYPFQKNATHHEIMNSMIDLYNQTMMSTLNLIDLNIFLKVVQVLKNSQRIIVFPTVGNIFYAECFQQNMLEIGQYVIVEKNIFYQHWVACQTNEHDVVIVISYANRTPNLDKVVMEVKKRHAKIILISSTIETELTKMADYNLYFASYEDSEEKIASFSSRISLQYLMDCLYACYFNRDYEKNLENKIKHFVEY